MIVITVNQYIFLEANKMFSELMAAHNLSYILKCFNPLLLKFFILGSFSFSYFYSVFIIVLVSIYLTRRSQSPICFNPYLFKFGPFAGSYTAAGIPWLIK